MVGPFTSSQKLYGKEIIYEIHKYHTNLYIKTYPMKKLVHEKIKNS